MHIKINFQNRTLILLVLIILVISTGNLTSLFASSNAGGYDTTRIYHAMDRARAGEDITIVVIGGSITSGTAASTIANRWANIMNDWWISTFPESTIKLINSGIGGTGSNVGAHRMKEDALDHNPDFIVVEFAVNDDNPNEQSEKMMEGIVRQTLADTNLPGVMILALMQQNGATAQESHKLVADYYDVPLVSFADSIQARVDRDGIPLSDAFNDVTHPNDVGMQYIADFLIEELSLIYNSLPATEDIPDASATLPAPRLTDTYSHCFMYNADNIVPLTNDGWSIEGTRWVADEEGDEISFAVDGNSISILYERHNTDANGQVEIWVGELAPKTLDAYWTETWGPAIVFSLIEEDLADGEHILHIRVNGENTAGGDGHRFEIININKAGNWEGLAPISSAGDNTKTVVGTEISLDGTASWHPENNPIESYNWSVVSAPAGNTDDINVPTDSITSITLNSAGTYEIGLVVGSGSYLSVQNIKTINVKATNTAPVAVAGNDTTVSIGSAVYLNGTGSYDADDDDLLYSWTLLSQPAGEDPRLSLMDTPTPRLVLREPGEYIMELIVNDSIVSSNPDQLTITAELVDAMKITSDSDLDIICSPNPALNILSVSYSLSFPQNVSLSLHALDGRQLFAYKLGNKNQGQYSYELNLSDLQIPNGIYFIKLNTSLESETAKFIKQ